MNRVVRGIVAFIFGALLGYSVVTLLSGCSPHSSNGSITRLVQPVLPAQGNETSVSNNSTTEVIAPSVPVKLQTRPEMSVKRIHNLDVPANRIIPIIGEVGENAVDAAFMIQRLNQQSSDPIFILLESPGGSVLHGAQLISAMQSSKAPVHTICQTICASMAFMIHQYGKKRYATDRTLLMAHPASAGTQGQVDNMASFVNSLQRYTNKLEIEVARRMGLTFEQYKLKTANEYWIDSEDAVKDHALDEIVSLNIDVSSLLKVQQQPSDKLRTHYKFDIIWITK